MRAKRRHENGGMAVILLTGVLRKRRIGSLCCLALLAVFFAWPPECAAWDSLVKFETHQYIDTKAYLLLADDPVFKAHKNLEFPGVEEVLSMEGVGETLTGPGPDSEGSSDFSEHYYNPTTREGRGPHAVSRYYGYLARALRENKRTDMASRKSAAWGAHFLADMFCPPHINGTTAERLLAIYHSQGGASAARITLSQNITGNPDELSYGSYFNHGDDWKKEVERFLSVYQKSPFEDFFDPWYWNGDINVAAFMRSPYWEVIQNLANRRVEQVWYVSSSHMMWETIRARGISYETNYNLTGYDPNWRNAEPGFDDPVGRQAGQAALFARRAANETLQNLTAWMADPDPAINRSIQGVYTLWRASFSALDTRMRVLKDPSLPGTYYVYGSLANYAGEDAAGARHRLGINGTGCSLGDDEVQEKGTISPSGSMTSVWKITALAPGDCRLKLEAIASFGSTPDLQYAYDEAPLESRIVDPGLKVVVSGKRKVVEGERVELRADLKARTAAAENFFGGGEVDFDWTEGTRRVGRGGTAEFSADEAGDFKIIVVAYREIDGRNIAVAAGEHHITVEEQPTCVYAYSDWGACSRETGTQTRTVIGKRPQGCIEKAEPETRQVCTPEEDLLPSCSYTYSEWGECSKQTRTRTRRVMARGPAGCIEKERPELEEFCTPREEQRSVCTYTYSEWGVCGDQTKRRSRTVTGRNPVGCIEGDKPVLEQGCTPALKEAAVCSYEYSDWGECSRASKTQTRSVTALKPAGCVEKGKPVLEQGCTPPPTEAEKRQAFLSCLCRFCGGSAGGYFALEGDCAGSCSCFGWLSGWCTAVPTGPEDNVKSCYAGVYGVKDPDARTLKDAAEEARKENRKKAKPLKATVNDGRCPVHAQLGDVVTLSAVIEGGLAPVGTSWSGDGEANGSRFTFIKTRRPGTHTVSVTATDDDGKSVTATCSIIVDAITVEIEKTSPADNTLPVGSRASFRAIVKSGPNQAGGDLKFLWQPHPEVQFGTADKPLFETTAPNTIATYTKMGTYQMSVNALKKLGDSYQTVGESNQIPMTIAMPKLSLTVNNKSPRIGDTVVLTVHEEPKMSDETISFWWEIKGGAVNPGPVPNVPNSRSYSFRPKDAKPVTVTVHGKAKDGGDDLGEESATVTAQTYGVSVTEPKYNGPPVRIWKCNTEFGGGPCGMVEVKDKFAVFTDIFMGAAVTPKPEGSLNYRWSVDPSGVCGIPGAGQQIRLNCSEAGTYAATVVVTNADGAELGRASGSVTVSVSQRDLDTSKKNQEAYEKLAKAKQLVSEGKLDEGIALAEEASGIDPKNAEAASLRSKWKQEKDAVVRHMERLKKLAEADKIAEAEKELSAAKALHPKYRPVVEAEKSLKEKMAAVGKKKKEAADKLATAKELVSRGKIEEGIRQAEEVSSIDPGNREAPDYAKKWKADKDKLTQHIESMKALADGGKLAEAGRELAAAKAVNAKYPPVAEAEKLLKTKTDEAKDRVAKAKELRAEGEALQKKDRLEEAVAKYWESLKYVPDRALEGHIETIGAKIAEKKKSRAAADAMWEEGRRLYDLKRPGDAIGKFRESIRLWSTPERAQYVRDLEAKMKKDIAEAKRLRSEGEAFQNQKRYQEAIGKFRESLKLLPDPEVEEHIRRIEDQVAREKDRKGEADRLWEEGRSLFDQKRPADALNKFRESIARWSDPKREDYVSSLEKEVAGKQAAAGRLRAEGEALQNQGRLADAVSKYRQSLDYWPDDRLEEHVAVLEGKIREVRDQDNRKTEAKRLRDEGYRLQQQNRTKDAIEKYRESLTYWPDPELEKYIRQLETTAVHKPTQDDLRYMKGFEGTWNSNWGRLEFKMSGAKILGNYTHDRGKIEATLSADGRTMEGMWLESPSYSPPHDGGRVVFSLSADGNRISGRWWYGQDSGGGDWTGTRILDGHGPAADSGPSRPGDLQTSEGRYKAVLVPGGITWQSARSAAEAMGGHLAVITSRAENDAVYDIVRNDDRFWYIDSYGNGIGPYLGGYQQPGSAEPSGGWRWVNGEALSYMNWAPGEPNNSGGQEHCLQFFGSRRLKGPQWNDIGCTAGTIKGYIVEFGRGAPTPGDDISGTPVPPVDSKVIFSNGNIAGVHNSPTKATTFTLRSPYMITLIENYHWNNGRGSVLGTIGLKDGSGRKYGPWKVRGFDGQGGVKNAYWRAYPNISLPAGAYTVVDSDPATWAQNSGSGGSGHTRVEGYPAGGSPLHAPSSGAVRTPDNGGRNTSSGSLTAEFSNRSGSPVHIFAEGQDSFGPQNKLSPGAKRKVPVTGPARGGFIRFIAGRNGQKLADCRWEYDPSAPARVPVVTFSDPPRLSCVTGLR